MLTNREKAYYKKLLTKKIEEAGIKDEIQFRVSKLQRVKNPAYDPAAPADPKNREFLGIPSFTAANLQRNLIKNMLKTDSDTIEAFLASDLSTLRPAEPAPSTPDAIAPVEDIVAAAAAKHGLKLGSAPEAPAEAAPAPSTEGTDGQP